MENKQSPSKKKLISIREEKLIREVNYDTLAGSPSRLNKKQLLLDLEILQKKPSQRPGSQRVLVSIKPRAPANKIIKTIYLAEKSKFHSKKASDKSGSRLAIGDHSSFTTHLSEDDSSTVNSIGCGTEQKTIKSEADSEIISTDTDQVESSTAISKCSKFNIASNKFKRPTQKCYVYTQPQLTMNLPKVNSKTEKSTCPNKVDIATLIVTNTSSEDTAQPSISTINDLHKRIDHLERKILRQEMVFRSIDPNIPLSSSDEELKENIMKSTSVTGRPGCSYIEQYSHIPETSAFQRYNQQTAPLSPSKATTLEKEHNSEQYGRDFTTYDGITARGRNKCASVPGKRDEIPKMAAERVHKIRHKLNPVRDYRLMDTVHYLAQGEFAPRDDGIKLTPSREAVLSDIIWEDVCRTHWPNARLGRRPPPHPERCTTRYELQRLIDSLLRERVAHVERRRRRHYRIVKLNNRHESCRPVGKTGDIIVASHKNKHPDERDVPMSEHNAPSAIVSERRWEDQTSRRTHRSHDRLVIAESRRKRRNIQDDSSPGPSHATSRSPTSREPTCCYRTSSPSKNERENVITPKKAGIIKTRDLTSGSSSTCKPHSRNPRLVIKKDNSHRRQNSREEPNLEHYILLPTLVVRTPSNMKRQKKFNELYHRILNVQLNNAQLNAVDTEAAERKPHQNPHKRDVGLNINITLSDSLEQMNKK